MRTLSPKQKQILNLIAPSIEDKGYAPTVRDVARGCGIGSCAVAQYHLNVLERGDLFDEAVTFLEALG